MIVCVYVIDDVMSGHMFDEMHDMIPLEWYVLCIKSNEMHDMICIISDEMHDMICIMYYVR